MSQASSPPLLRRRTWQGLSLLVALGGVLALALLTARLPWPGPQRALAAAVLAVPLLMGLAQFSYKLRVGIRKPWLALTWWALWQSYAWATPLVLLARHAPDRLPLLAAGALAVQLLALGAALQRPTQHLRTLVIPCVSCALSLAGQLAVLLASS